MLSRKNKNRLHRRLINTPGFRFFNALESGASQATPEVKNLPTNAEDIKETRVQSLSWEDPRRRAWRPTPVFLPPRTEEPGGLRSMGSHRVGPD